MLRTTRLLIIFFSVLTTPTIASEAVNKGKVAFFAEHEGGLFVLNTVDGSIRSVSVGFLGIGDLAYSPKSNLLAFVGASSHSELSSLYLLDLESNKKELIYKSQANHTLYRPAFDRTGQYLYAVNYESGIHKYSLASKTWNKVKVSGIKDLNPQGIAFSSSGKKVAISPGNFEGLIIANVESDRLEVIGYLLKEFGTCINPQWIDENSLVFAGRATPGLQFLWKLDIYSEKLTQITHPPLGVRDFLSLSKDGDKIVFTGTTEREWRLWQVNIDGTELLQLTKGGELSSHLSPVWVE